jgi:hypothetical protein
MANYYGIYLGVVTNATDPASKGRLQVSVPSLGIGGSLWAQACREYNSTAAPPVGTNVWVMFQAGDFRFPVWMGCAV